MYAGERDTFPQYIPLPYTCFTASIESVSTLATERFSFLADNAVQMVSVMRTFMLALVLHPDVQKKAQEEIDP